MVLNVYLPYDHFDMNSLWFGCAILNSVAHVPADCTVLAKGETVDDVAVSISYEFEGRALTTTQMNHIVFPNTFKNL
jgi:hypothetical protein